jgi:hypothetical protein
MGVISMRSSRIACWSRPASAPGRSGTRHQADVSATNRSSPPSSSATCIPLLVVVSQLLDVRERLAVEPPRVDDPLRKLGQSSSSFLVGHRRSLGGDQRDCALTFHRTQGYPVQRP